MGTAANPSTGRPGGDSPEFLADPFPSYARLRQKGVRARLVSAGDGSTSWHKTGTASI